MDKIPVLREHVPGKCPKRLVRCVLEIDKEADRKAPEPRIGDLVACIPGGKHQGDEQLPQRRVPQDSRISRPVHEFPVAPRPDLDRIEPPPPPGCSASYVPSNTLCQSIPL